MNKNRNWKGFYTLLTLMVLLLISCNMPGREAEAEQDLSDAPVASGGEFYPVIPEKSGIEWMGKKITGKHTGTLMIQDGEFRVKAGEVLSGSFIMDMNSIEVTDLEGKDKEDLETHLKDTDFFETHEFPTGKFVITEVQKGKDPAFTHEVFGNLTLKGITRRIQFPAVIRVEGEELLANANFNIDRSLWGIKYKGRLDNVIQDEINLVVNIFARKN
jgi:polyisoprenoid-binding protein YceI